MGLQGDFHRAYKEFSFGSRGRIPLGLKEISFRSRRIFPLGLKEISLGSGKKFPLDLQGDFLWVKNIFIERRFPSDLARGSL